LIYGDIYQQNDLQRPSSSETITNSDTVLHDEEYESISVKTGDVLLIWKN